MEWEGVEQQGVSELVRGFLSVKDLTLPKDTRFCFWEIAMATNWQAHFMLPPDGRQESMLATLKRNERDV